MTYADVYPGIDLTLYGNGQHLEHDFIVKPGADWKRVRMTYDGAQGFSLDRMGNLHVRMADSELVMRAPDVYQMENGRRSERSARYVLLGSRRVGFAIDGVDRNAVLIIDPILDFSTYLADSSLYIGGVAADPTGNTYIVGETFSSSYPVTPGAVQPTCSSCPDYGDIFVTKLNVTGTARVYSTFIGGNNFDQPDAIAVDAKGNAVVTGFTSSTDYPLKNPIASGTASYDDGFITSLSADGASFNFSSRLGGSSSISSAADTYPSAVATDSSGNVYVSGTTESPYLPVTTGALNEGTPSYTNSYIFLTKLSLNGALVYSAIVGNPGTASEGVGTTGLSIDSTGTAYMGGTVGQGPTLSGTATPWPTTSGAYQTALISSNQNAPFAAKVSADGSSLLYSTLVGSGHAYAMTVDSQGEVLLAGFPGSGFPVSSNAYSSTIGNSFVAKVSTNGTSLPYASYFGSSASITGMATDQTGNLWLVGNSGPGLPLVDPLQSNSGSSDTTGYVAELDPLLKTLLFSSYFSGPQGETQMTGVAIDAQSRVHIAGTAPDDLPTTSGAVLGSVTPPPPNYNYAYGFAAVIDPKGTAPAVCVGSVQPADVQVGSSGQGSFQVSNCGAAPLVISAFQIQAPLFQFTSSTECVETLAVGASCTVNYIFTPSTAGSFSAVTAIRSDAPISSQNVTIQGYGTAPSIQLYSNQIDFPTQVLGVAGLNVPLFIGNQGSAPLVINTSSTKITGPFRVTSNTCSSPVSPSSLCMYSLIYQPTAAGTDTGSLTLFSNDPVAPQVTVALTGTTLSAYSTPAITGIRPSAFALNAPANLIRVSGSNFFPASQIVVGGEPLPTTFSSSNLLSATVDASLLTSVGELPVIVINSAPGGSSIAVALPVFHGLPLSAAGLVYESVGKLLYISIPASATTDPNTVVSVDPLTGAMGTPIAVGNDPGTLAVASDGSSLFVGVNGDHTLQRINLSTHQVDRTFTLPIGSSAEATTVKDMHVVPGSPQSVVVSLSPGEQGVALFNDSGLVSFVQNDALDSFTFASSPSTIYDFPFASGFFGVTQVSASALTTVTSGASCCNETTGSLIASDGTLLYTNSGEIWNPTTKALVGTLTPTPATYPLGQFFYEPSVLPDPTTSRTFFLDSLANGDSIFAFNPTALTQTGVISVPAASYPTDLVRWGSDGFAFRVYGGSAYGSANDQLVLIRSKLADTGIGGTPALTSIAPANADAGSPTFTLTISGSQFIPGSTVLWNGTARQTTFVSSTQLTSVIPSTDVARSGTASVAVSNPGGSSSALSFAISGPGVPAVLTAPTPGTTLSTSATFTWTAGSGVTAYQLWLGTTANANNIYNSHGTLSLSETVTGIPASGGTIFVTLFSQINGAYKSNAYTFIASGTPAKAVLTTPAPGAKLTDASATFGWTLGTGVTAYQLWLGSKPGINDIFNSGGTTNLSVTVNNLPANGGTVFATLFSLIDGSYTSNSYRYIAVGTPAQAILTSPTAGSTLSTSATFAWTTGTGVSNYQLWLGTTAGTNNIYNSSGTYSTSLTVTNIPANGGTIFVTLFFLIDGVYKSNAYTFIASGTPARAVLTSPTPSTKLSGSSVTFGWTAGAGVTAYQFWLGTTAGASDLFNSHGTAALSATVTGLPTNGTTVYATLYSLIDGSYKSNAYTFAASGAP